MRGISGIDISEARVAMRVSQGGHDVPAEKLIARYPRTMLNLRLALRELPLVMLFDNDDLRAPFRQVAVFHDGQRKSLHKPAPRWLKPILA